MTELWQSRVKITQIPSEVDEEEIVYTRFFEKEKISIKKSWMYDIFSDQSINGLEVRSNKYFSMTFIKQAHSFEDAIKKSFLMLNSLEYRFPGLSAVEKQVRFKIADIDQFHSLYEIILQGKRTKKKMKKMRNQLKMNGFLF